MNELFLTLTPILECLDEHQRKDVDEKVATLHKHWTQLTNITKTRTELSTIFSQFLDESESLERVLDEVELILRTAANEESLKQIDKAWVVIKSSHEEIKLTGQRVLQQLDKVN